ncbi:alkane 1-monooxygenase [Fontimonas thermophila]|uniref:Alkane 1-monooxygenase n=1 Tax=Fontimonas thermophila TaxID=1076937 RepID=A0A1I2KHB9_9GAMM|nr:alkane 1-monooxygenase [Fontimonas thermophila]8SBB_A Chain A, Alkane 1-monooxygenase [Fontimonas thermophila]SFF66422.1 alkane 1-monooxygenase [Fontimonas thermophila]
MATSMGSHPGFGADSSGTIAYRDRKRPFWTLSVLWPVSPLIGIYLAHTTGVGAFFWLTLAVWYLIIPLLDWVLGDDQSNPPEAVVPALESDRYYRILTYLTVPIHYVVLIGSAWYVSTHYGSMTWYDILGLALSVGIVNGLAINTGHELGHKKTELERWLAKIVLAVVGYGHFFIEHNKGHHKDVATPEDPASAPFGQSIYRFALREIPGAIIRAWNSEKERLGRLGHSPWSLQNEVLQPLLITIPLYVGLIAVLGVKIIPFLLIQIVFGWWQLTSANYIEHYGLLRQKLPDGRYERCQPYHSWNSNHVMSNLILFHLQRHSDHHAHPTRRYQSLRDFPDLPTLPSGYPLMFALSYFPPLWRAVMDRRVLDVCGRDARKINIDPNQREKIIHKFNLLTG